jgi:hypothetical protein
MSEQLPSKEPFNKRAKKVAVAIGAAALLGLAIL